MANVTLDPRKAFFYDPDGANAPLTVFFPNSADVPQDISLFIVNRTNSATPIIFAAQGSDVIAKPWASSEKVASFTCGIPELHCQYMLVGTEWRLIEQAKPDAMVLRGPWDSNREYFTGDVVIDSDWTMCANKATFGRPAPQPNGTPAWILPDTPTWVTNQQTAVIYSGHEYTFTEPVLVSGIRCWAPELTGTTNYRVVFVDNTDPLFPIYTVIEEPILSNNDWTILRSGNKLLSTGSKLLIFLDAYNSGGDTIVTGGWTYEGPQNTAAPPAQNWNRRTQNDVVRISHTDLDSTDRTSELQGVIPNSTIEIVETASPDNNLLYRVNSRVTNGASEEYAVNLISSNGEIVAATTCTINITVPIPQATKYVQLADHWLTGQPSYASVIGRLEFDGVAQPVPNDAFGIDLKVVPASVSPDWDYVAFYSN